MSLQHKAFPAVDFKVLNEDQGVFEAYVSVFDVIDHANERVKPGFFKASLEKRLPKVVFNHDWNRPIGKTLPGTEERYAGDERLPEGLRGYGGLYCVAQLNLDVQDARDAFSHLKFGSLDEFSFGYDVSRAVKAKDGVRDLLEGTTFEVSPVLIGCNPATQLVGVKAIEASTEPLTLTELRDYCDSLFHAKIHPLLFDSSTDVEERLIAIKAHAAELPVMIERSLRALLTSVSDDDQKDALEADYKEIFAVPARVAGRLSHQIDAWLAHGDDLVDRLKTILPLRQEQGRSFTPERWEQIEAIHSHTKTLLSARVTEEAESVDFSLLQLQAEIEQSRLALARISAR